MTDSHTHVWKPLRQESSHDGACYHIGSCIVDVMYCEGCGTTLKPTSQYSAYTTSTGTRPLYQEVERVKRHSRTSEAQDE